MTSMPPTVTTPSLLSPDNSAGTGASRKIPPIARPVARASTGGTFPEVIAASVATTTTAATTVTANLYTSTDHGGDGTATHRPKRTLEMQSRSHAA